MRPQRIQWQQFWSIKQKESVNANVLRQVLLFNSPSNGSYTNTRWPGWTLMLLEQKDPAIWESKIAVLLPRRCLGQAIELPFPLYFCISVIRSSHRLQIQWTPLFLSLCVFILFSECRNMEPKYLHCQTNCTSKNTWIDHWKLTKLALWFLSWSIERQRC